MIRVTGDSGAVYVVDEVPAGCGGQALVHAATCEDDGARVALRVARAAGELGLYLRRQAELQRTLLGGPLGRHVLPVFDEGTWAGRPFLITTWVPRTLRDAGPDRALLLRLVALVENLGDHEFVHGDLTPGNVLLPEGGDLWLSDWTPAGAAWFTPGFAPPEQVLGHPASPAFDRFALAATVWTVLSGHVPSGPARIAGCLNADARAAGDGLRAWTVEAAFELGRCHVDDEDRRRFDAAVPGSEPLRTVLEALLEPSPRRRSQDLSPLCAALAGRPVRRRPRRWPWALGAGGLLVVGLGVATPARRCAPGFATAGHARCEHPDGRSAIRIGATTALVGTGGEAVPDNPIHRVFLPRPYELDRTEVTQGEWRRVMGENPMAERDQLLDDHVRAPCFHWKGRTLVGDALPVACVSFFDAVRYANRRSALDGLPPAYAVSGTQVSWDRSSTGWRLPTEAEWEVAARAGTVLVPGHLCRTANVRDRSALERWGGEPACDDGAPTLAPVGSYPPNPWGFVDLYGNVAEWTWDRYEVRPEGWGFDPVGPPHGPTRTYRGSSWMHVPRGVEARYAMVPEARDFSVGLRLARFSD